MRWRCAGSIFWGSTVPLEVARWSGDRLNPRGYFGLHCTTSAYYGPVARDVNCRLTDKVFMHGDYYRRPPLELRLRKIYYCLYQDIV